MKSSKRNSGSATQGNRGLNRMTPSRGCSSAVERSLCMWKAPGSIPRISTKTFCRFSLQIYGFSFLTVSSKYSLSMWPRQESFLLVTFFRRKCTISIKNWDPYYRSFPLFVSSILCENPPFWDRFVPPPPSPHPGLRLNAPLSPQLNIPSAPKQKRKNTNVKIKTKFTLVYKIQRI